MARNGEGNGLPLPRAHELPARQGHPALNTACSNLAALINTLLQRGEWHWINENRIVAGNFAWCRGYGAFSVSHSGVDEVAKDIATQEEHHRKKTFVEQLRQLVERYGLSWHEDKTVETVADSPSPPSPPR